MLKVTREFGLAADDAVTMLLNFDDDRSIHETANSRYMMSPVIGIVGVQ